MWQLTIKFNHSRQPGHVITAQDLRNVQVMLEQMAQHTGQHLPNIRPRYRNHFQTKWKKVPYPRGIKITKFTLFSGEADQSTLEHISRFVTRCGDASHVDC